jgi:hypothetical protein
LKSITPRVAPAGRLESLIGFCPKANAYLYLARLIGGVGF